MYRFFDRHGRTLALRPDMTSHCARGGTRLYDQRGRCGSATSAASSAMSAAGGPAARVHPGRCRADGRARRDGGRRSYALAVAALRAVGLPSSASRSATSASSAAAAGAGSARTVGGRLRSAVDRKAEAELVALLQEVPRLTPVVRRPRSPCFA